MPLLQQWQATIIWCNRMWLRMIWKVSIYCFIVIWLSTWTFFRLFHYFWIFIAFFSTVTSSLPIKITQALIAYEYLSETSVSHWNLYEKIISNADLNQIHLNILNTWVKLILSRSLFSMAWQTHLVGKGFIVIVVLVSLLFQWFSF